MPVADKVSVELEARFGRYEADLNRAQRAFDGTMGRMGRSAGQMETQVNASVRSAAAAIGRAAGAFGVAFSAQAVSQMADQFTRFTNSLRVAGLEGANLRQVQNELYRQAQQGAVSLETVSALYGRIATTQRELGASQGQMLQFTEGVVNALRVSGSSAEAAQGALLQLGQALGGGTVRAEEFNSILEGARPILQAVAAGSDRFGGSVAKLRSEVLEGTVSSQEFFQAFLRGAPMLEQQAGRAVLTLDQSLQQLKNSLVFSVGQMDATLDASARLAGGITWLANNLDVLGNVVGIVAALMIGRFVTATVATNASLGVMGAQLARGAAQMNLLGTAAGIAAGGVRTLGASLLTLVGGPWGLAIAGLAIAIGSMAGEAMEAAQDVETLSRATDEANQKLDAMEAAARTAGGEARGVGSDSVAAALGIQQFGGEAGAAAQKLYDLAAAAKAARYEMLATQFSEVQTRREAAQQRLPEVRRNLLRPEARGSAANAWNALTGFLGGEARNVWTGGESDAATRREIAEADAALRRLQQRMEQELATPVSAAEGRAARSALASGGDAKAGGRGRSRSAGDDAADRAREAQRLADQRRQLELLRMSMEVEVQRAAGNERQAIAIEQQAQLMALIARYEDLGLTAAQARTQAETDLGRLYAQQARQRLEAQAALREEIQLEAAQLAQNYALVQTLEDQAFLREQTRRYQQEGLNLAEATAQAERDLANIAQARADARQREVEAQREQFALRLAEARGDERAADAIRRQQRIRNRADEIGRTTGAGRDDSVAQATEEERQLRVAELQGQFRSAFREGVRAAIDGDLGDFLADRLQRAADHMFDRAIDTLADALFNLASQFASSMAQRGGAGGSFWEAAAAFLGGSGGGGKNIAGKQHGGWVQGGRPYRVNEGIGQSEVFVPPGAGQIVNPGVTQVRPQVNLRVVNATGVPVRADVQQSGEETRLNLQPLLRQGLDAAARDGTLMRAQRQARQPVRRG